MSFWSLRSCPAMQSESCLAFGTRSASMLLHLLIFALCVFCQLQRWHVGPPFLWASGTLAFRLFSFIWVLLQVCESLSPYRLPEVLERVCNPIMLWISMLRNISCCKPERKLETTRLPYQVYTQTNVLKHATNTLVSHCILARMPAGICMLLDRW